MTDSHLMDADCVHGNVWYECPLCDAEDAKYFDEELKKELQEFDDRLKNIIAPDD
jgi:hypothetical protein